jgi:Crp-like helix-turn-helix domain
MRASASLQSLLLKYVQTFLVQTAHTTIANARTKLDQRLARWLLMAHDRLDGDSLPLTHEFLSLMLGVRRAGVPEPLHALVTEKLIRAARSEIVVLNRKDSSGGRANPMAYRKRSFDGCSGDTRLMPAAKTADAPRGTARRRRTVRWHPPCRCRLFR